MVNSGTIEHRPIPPPAGSNYPTGRSAHPHHHCQQTDEMAKSKNHTNHNQNKKAHRNGIKKPKTHFAGSMKGVDAKFRRNQKYARLGTQKALAAKKAEAAA
ncbi:60S ribosomal protein L29 OS=Schizosaccharomyces pombe (strain 972 / ATCC 24843) GN=rpl29 PE=3 SV=3 [Rhizoctonia solani AG-1 IB]|uniref:60S ribosomal protein L29 n=1 Tax=Thanatephorus cucumeris (strain AG1-IB / isolate 7/3/14) TaxID=1108050 RepID=A0A0B7G1I8_THACB|nr:60S ribosomal protein L29 OS=Schizosaccharomyces pombe (strain 972 / ATCC 24843) GN=rpl29 PE=3 SV=3 [Rhizoctonia solani AG-1 IB]